jgi:hypothetical protein
MATASSRREILAATAAVAGGGGAALLASCGGGSKSPPAQTVSTTQMQADAAVANGLIDLEASAVVAYGDVGARLRGGARAVARQFEIHERGHLAAIRQAVRRLGETPRAVKSPAEYRAAFPPLPDAHAALGFALDVEATAIAAYADALTKIATDSLRVTLATILATESEHAAVLLGRLGRPQVPDAFVTGPPPPDGSG